MTTITTELAQRMREAALKATPGPWGITRDGMTVTSNQSHPIATLSGAGHRMLSDGSTGQDAEFIALANPVNVLALLGALDSAKILIEQYGAENSKMGNDIMRKLVMETGLRQQIRRMEHQISGLEARTEQQPVAFDDLRDAVAEMSGGLALQWSDGCKGHQVVPFINFNSLSRIVEKFRAAPAAQPVTVTLPDRRDESYEWDDVTPSEAFNTCRSICGLMFRQALRKAGIAIAEGG